MAIAHRDSKVGAGERPTGVDRLRDDRARASSATPSSRSPPWSPTSSSTCSATGVDVVIKPPAEALEQMDDFVRDMHTSSGLLAELDAGVTLAEAEQLVLGYVAEHCPEGSRPPLAGNTIGTDRMFLARDMPALDVVPALPRRRRLLDQGAGPALVPPRLLQRPGEARQPPRARRHPGEHRGAALLPGRGLRARPRAAGRPRRKRARAAARRIAHRRGRGPGHAPDSRYTCRCSAGRSRRPRAVMVGVAQLVEHLVVVPDVAGSSPVTHPS